ncbi:MAG: phosphate ABC transporter permease subunit PstC [Bacillota bacterium]|nr:phosphate ABC transporter permease subunit PstC [Bacillota bacterium]
MLSHERRVEQALLVSALSSVFILGLIIVFIFFEGLPAFRAAGVAGFFTGLKWAPTKSVFGILPMILGSLWVTAGALILGAPVGVLCAVFLAEFAPPRVADAARVSVQMLAAIPSVVFGFIGLLFVVPFVREHIGGPGFSVLASSIVLGIMILPTVVSISLDAIESLPRSYKEGAMALGATRWQTVSMVILPSARSGILAATILGMGRALGETMAVIMVAGNSLKIPSGLLSPVRTLTSGIALEMGYAEGLHRQALFAMGIVLMALILALNLVASAVSRGRSR